MIRFLSIQRLAVIDAVDIEFEPGLNVLTGETGAGKSIVVGAVGLLLGGRASADLVRTGEDDALAQAIFETPDGREVIVRREISAQGRSRAFVDGALVTSGSLKELCGGFVDLHGQHEHQVLLDPDSHLDLLDEYAGLQSDREQTAARFGALQETGKDLDRARGDERDRVSRLDLVTFQLGEIDRVVPREGEDEELATTRQVLANAERLQRLCNESYVALYEGDEAVLGALGGVWRRVAELASVDPKFAPFLETRDVVKSQLEELAYFLRSYASEIESSPDRLQQVEDRLAALERLKKKHGPALAEVIAKRGALESERHALEHVEERVAQLEKAFAAARDGYLEAARGLSERRKSAAPAFTRALEKLLAKLAMGHARCEVRFADASAGDAGWTARGVDVAEFYLSPNPGEDLRPLARIASGGELSRIMLALKTMASADAPGRTLIFDEVDAGIGGRVADVVGSQLQQLGERFQVLCITHLPQIAAHASTHFTVEKEVRAGRTKTHVRRLAQDERERELARMIGGEAGGAAVMASARELLAARRAGSPKGPKSRAGLQPRQSVQARESGRKAK
jgi:DNA repair protein RecN (Recombination protein N)